MSDGTADQDKDLAVIEAAQETCKDMAEGDSFEEGDAPGSPKSDSEWELLPDATAPSDCGSSVKSVHVDSASVSTSYPEKTTDVTPYLQIKLSPQGSSDVSLQLTVQDHTASPLPNTAVLSNTHAQWQYQDQLRKAQKTLLHQATPTSTVERAGRLEAQLQQQGSTYDALTGSDTTAPESMVDDTLPTSTHMLTQEDIPDTISATDSPCAPSSQGPQFRPESHSSGHLSFMSDGSFTHVEGPASPHDAECHDGVETQQENAKPADLTKLMPVDLMEPAAQDAPSQEANTVLDRLSEDMSEHAAEASIASVHTEAAEDSSQEQGDGGHTAAHKQPTWPRLAAAIRHRLTQLLSALQAWTSSAHGFLPSSASVYASTVSVFGSKSPLRRLDGGHWSLVSGLVVVSAVYFFREHGHTTRERRLRKELLNSQAEISKLVMKVVNMQHSMQSPGRVPIIRHTCSMSAVTPFPLMHLV